MANVLIVAYLLIVLALIGVILLQRSEGGGLGMGSSSNGLMTVRGSANLLTRTTAVLAALFFATAIGLTILSDVENRSSDILRGAADSASSDINAPTSVLDALNALEGDDSLNVPAAPQTDAAPGTDPALSVPAAPATDAAPATSGADPALSVPAAPAADAPAGSDAAPAAESTPTPAPADTSSPAATGTQTPAAPAN